MRLHITLEDDLVADLDQRVGSRGRSAFIAESVRSALEDLHRWELIESAIGGASEGGHDWDPGPAEWVRRQRRVDPQRIG
ncbi:MAG: hypothetical protein ACR2K6_07305 [Solirubrobacterales bacterium]